VTNTQQRVWQVLAAATFAGALLDLPYTADLLQQRAWAYPRSVNSILFVNALLTVLFQWLLAALGLVLAARLALGAPLVEAWVERRPAEARRTLSQPVLWGLLTGALLLVQAALVEKPLERFLPTTMTNPPWWAGVMASFAAGIGEEVMTRLFLLSAVAVVLVRFLPKGASLWSANVIAALAFGALHFANVHTMGLTLNPVVVTYILLVNGGVGLLCGWLFWTRGIEAAMACHTSIDLVLHGLGAVFRESGGA
jgi:membrane protease YdiL (CAAX protease family)